MTGWFDYPIDKDPAALVRPAEPASVPPAVPAPVEPARPLPDPTADLPPLPPPPKAEPPPPKAEPPPAAVPAYTPTPVCPPTPPPAPADWRELAHWPGYQAYGQVDAAGVWRYDPGTIRPITPAPVVGSPPPAPPYTPPPGPQWGTSWTYPQSTPASSCPGGQCGKSSWRFPRR